MANPVPPGLKPFAPGVSGNPSGRSKSLERRVRELLGEDIDAMTRVLRDIVLGVRPVIGADGQPVIGPDGSPVTEATKGINGVRIVTRDRIEAYKVLADRGWGKARQTVDVTGDLTIGQRPGPDLAPLTEAQLEVLAQLDEGQDDVPAATPE